MPVSTNTIISGAPTILQLSGRNQDYNVVGGYVPPALNLNFLGDALPNGLTFTRASNATMFDSSGNLVTVGNDVARLEYDPATLTIRGLLIEEQRTNFTNTSLDAGTSSATSNAGSIVDSTVLGRTMVTFTADGTSAGHYFFSGNPTTAIAASTVHAFSGFVKAGTAQYVQVTPGASHPVDSSNTYINIDTTTGTIVSLGTAVLSSGVIPCGNNTWRVWGTFTSAATTGTGTSVVVAIIPAAASARLAASTATTTVSGGGFQLEQGNFPSSYIPTNGAAATRAADSISDLLYAFPGAFTLFGEFSRSVIPSTSVGANASIVRARNSGNTDFAAILCGTGTPAQQRLDVTTAGTGIVGLSVALAAAGVIYKIAGRIATADFRMAQNGTLSSAVTTGAAPSPDRFSFGSTAGTNNFLNGHLRKIALYTSALTDDQLQAITS